MNLIIIIIKDYSLFSELHLNMIKIYYTNRMIFTLSYLTAYLTKLLLKYSNKYNISVKKNLKIIFFYLWNIAESQTGIYNDRIGKCLYSFYVKYIYIVL